jgi:magnesium transporter
VAPPDDVAAAFGPTSAAPSAAAVPSVPPISGGERPERVEPANPAAGLPCSYYVGPDGAFTRNLSAPDLARVIASGEGTLWVDVDSTVRSQTSLLESVFDMHPLAAEDAVNPNSRVKVEEYPNGLFAIVRGVELCEDTADPYDVRTYNLSFFLRHNLLVTTHATASPAVRAMTERVNRSSDVLARGSVYLMHQMMDASVDAYFPVVDQIDDFIDDIEQSVFVEFDPEAMRDIYETRRLVLNLRRQLAPQREVFNALANRPMPLIPTNAQRYFRDVYDHVMRIYDSLDAQRDLLGGTLDSYLTQVNNRTGEATKALSVVATLSIPFVMVSGMWGMNFARVPLSNHPHGFAIMMAIQIAMGVGLIWVLRRRGLL